MAKRVIEELVDDLDGSVAADTIHFSFEGSDYQIDLSYDNMAQLREMMARYVDAARKTPGTIARRPGIPPTRGFYRRTTLAPAGATRRQELQAIRDWAEKQGIKVSPFGRIKHEVEEQYRHRNDAAKNGTAVPAAVFRNADVVLDGTSGTTPEPAAGVLQNMAPVRTPKVPSPRRLRDQKAKAGAA